MIVKIKKGHGRMDKLIHYLYGPGRANQHENQRAVAATVGLDVGLGEMISTDEVVYLVNQMRTNRVMYEFEGDDVWHMSLSIPKSDGVLSDEVWAKISRDAMERLGFDGGGVSPCPWVAVRHGLSAEGNDHVHLAVSLVREDGTEAKTWNDFKNMSTFAREVEQEYGLSVVDGRTAGASKGISRHDLEHACRNGLVEAERETLGRKMRAASTAASSEADYVARLKMVGVSVRPFVEEGAVSGYSVVLVDSSEPIPFSASGVDTQLGLNKLRARMGWDLNDSDVGVWLEPGEVAVGGGDLKEAAAVVTRVASEVEGVDDPAVLAGVAADTAGVYASLAERFEPGGLGQIGAVSKTLGRSANVDEGVKRNDMLAGVAAVAMAAKVDGASGLVLLLSRLSRLSEVIRQQHQIRGELNRSRNLGSDQQDLLNAVIEFKERRKATRSDPSRPVRRVDPNREQEQKMYQRRIQQQRQAERGFGR